MYFGDGRRAVTEPMLPPFDVLLSYEDLKGKQHRNTCRLDVAQFDGFARLGNPPEQDMAKALVHRQGDMAGYQNPRLPVAITLAMPGNGHIAWRSNLTLSG